MAEGLNISTGIGEGDANVLHWGAVDKAADRLYQEQLRRKALAQQQYQQQQLAFQKELGAIRSADIPDAVNAYNKRKNIAQQLYFDKNLHKDPIKYAQAQMALKQADADYYGVVNSSKETMLSDKNVSEDLLKNHDLYAPDASDKFQQWNNIPTSERRKQNLLGNTTLLSPLPDVDYTAIVKESVGEPKDYPAGKEMLSENKQQYIVPYISRANQPEQIKDNIIGKFDVRKAGKDAYKILRQIPPQSIEEINKRYDLIPNDQYRTLYGKDKPDLNPKNPDNPVEVIASYEAKKQVLTNPPKAAKPVTRVNPDYAYAQQKEMERLRQQGRLALLNKRIAAAKDLKKMSAKDEDLWSEEYLNEGIKEATAGAGDPKKDFYAKPAIITDPLLMKAFERDGYEPDAIIYKDGKYIPTFYKRDKDNNVIKGEDDKPEIIQQYTQPISKKQAKVLLLKVAPNSKRDAQEIGFSLDELGGEDSQENLVTDPYLLKLLNEEQ